jgi:hypothetical protein
MARGVGQTVECLPSKCEALSSNTETAKKVLIIMKKRKRKYGLTKGTK